MRFKAGFVDFFSRLVFAFAHYYSLCKYVRHVCVCAQVHSVQCALHDLYIKFHVHSIKFVSRCILLKLLLVTCIYERRARRRVCLFSFDWIKAMPTRGYYQLFVRSLFPIDMINSIDAIVKIYDRKNLFCKIILLLFRRPWMNDVDGVHCASCIILSLLPSFVCSSSRAFFFLLQYVCMWKAFSYCVVLRLRNWIDWMSWTE